MEDSLLAWLESHLDLSLYLVPLLAFAEACIGIGLLVSGIFLVVVSTLALSQGHATLEQLIALALLGATCGDHVGYYAGRWIGPRMHHAAFARRHRARLERTESMVRRYGALAIFIGRFVSAVRSLVPAVLGISGFPRNRYTPLDVLACLLWACALGAIVSGATRLL